MGKHHEPPRSEVVASGLSLKQLAQHVGEIRRGDELFLATDAIVAHGNNYDENVPSPLRRAARHAQRRMISLGDDPKMIGTSRSIVLNVRLALLRLAYEDRGPVTKRQANDIEGLAKDAISAGRPQVAEIARGLVL